MNDLWRSPTFRDALITHIQWNNAFVVLGTSRRGAQGDAVSMFDVLNEFLANVIPSHSITTLSQCEREIILDRTNLANSSAYDHFFSKQASMPIAGDPRRRSHTRVALLSETSLRSHA